MKGILKRTDDGWVIIKNKYGIWEESIPLHPEDAEELSSILEEGVEVKYEVVDLYEGEKLPWNFAKIINNDRL